MRIKFAWFLLFVVLAVGAAQNDESEDPAEMDFGGGDDEGESTTKVLIEDKHVYVRPVVNGEHYFVETFDEETIIGGKWIKSEAKKDGVEDEEIAKYDGTWSVESSRDSVLEGDKGLVLKSKAKHHAISSRLVKPFHFDSSNIKSLVIQYEVKFQNVLECGGAYVKLLATDPKLTLEQFYDKTSFSIMFGPDKCGGESKYHFILRFRNPKTGVYEEHHAKKSELPDGLFADGKTHLYTLILKPDNTYQMLIDNADINTGSLLSDLTPPINPPKEIVDPNDKKPADWDDREQIADPEAVRPADWDESEPKLIDDPEAVKPDGWLDDEPEMIDDEMAIKPDDWDVETDGEWEAPKLENPKCKSGVPGCGKWSPPQIANPKYKGKWSAPLVNNPRYQGIWEPRKIENPAYFEDEAPFKSLTSFEAVGLELWSMTDQIYFDNFIITDDETVANEFAQASWAIKKKLESQRSASQAGSSDSVVGAFLKAAEEKPWLWAVVVLVVLLPIILIVVFCCGSSSKSSTSTDAKKTDAVQPDDNESTAQASSNQQGDGEEEQEEEEPEEEEEEIEQPTEAKKSPIKKRARKD